MSSSLWALLISLARRPTVDASMVSSDNELAKASPESFSTTRCHRGRAPPTSSSATSVTSAAPPRSRADDGLSKTEQLRTAEELPDRVLLVPDERLLEQDALFVPALEASRGSDNALLSCAAEPFPKGCAKTGFGLGELKSGAELAVSGLAPGVRPARHRRTRSEVWAGLRPAAPTTRLSAAPAVPEGYFCCQRTATSLSPNSRRAASASRVPRAVRGRRSAGLWRSAKGRSGGETMSVGRRDFTGFAGGALGSP